MIHITSFDIFSERKEKVQDIWRNIRDAILTITDAMSQIEPPLDCEPQNQEYADYILDECTKPNFSYPEVYSQLDLQLLILREFVGLF